MFMKLVVFTASKRIFSKTAKYLQVLYSTTISYRHCPTVQKRIYTVLLDDIHATSSLLRAVMAPENNC